MHKGSAGWPQHLILSAAIFVLAFAAMMYMAIEQLAWVTLLRQKKPRLPAGFKLYATATDAVRVSWLA